MRLSSASNRFANPSLGGKWGKVFFAASILVFLGAVLPGTANAQTARPVGFFTVGGGFNAPVDMASDSTGNVYVIDRNNGLLKEIVAFNGRVSATSTVVTLVSGLNQPWGVTLDSKGDVFFTDTNNNLVKEMVAVNGVVSSTSTIITLGSGFNAPYGLVVDSNGNVFVSDANSNSIKKIVAVGGVVSSSSSVQSVGSGFCSPHSVALDGSGDVFVADQCNQAVKEIVATNGVVSSSSTVNTVGSGFFYPTGVAVDASGNVYVADFANHAVKVIVAVNGVVSSSSAVNYIGGGFYSPTGVTIDSNGNLFVADGAYNRVTENIGAPWQLPATALGSTSGSIPALFTFDSGGTLASTPYLVLTQGNLNGDFQAAATQDGDACVTGQYYNGGAVCTVEVTFTPTRLGQRLGAVQLMGSSGTPIAVGNLFGTGTGPMATFGGPTLGVIGSGFTNPIAVAIDGSGNVFVATTTSSAVYEVMAVNGAVSSSSTIRTVGGGFNVPSELAIDGNGNIFVADTGNQSVYEIMAVNGAVSSTSVVNTLLSGSGSPTGVAVDKSGNLFVADASGSGAVYEILAVNGVVSSGSALKPVASGFNAPHDVTVDSSGNVYVADSNNNAVKEIVAFNGVVSTSSAVNTIGSGFTTPSGLAVAADGGIVVTDSGNDAVKEIMPVNGVVSTSSTVQALASGVTSPAGVAVDGIGHFFVAQTTLNQVSQWDVTSPPALSFASSQIGLTSPDSPQTVMITNWGNAALTFEIPTTGQNPSISTSFTLSNSSTCPQLTTGSSTATLAVGASCLAYVSFTPTVLGPVIGSMIFTDNSLNATGPIYATQNVALSGLATGPPVIATAAIPSVALTRNRAATTFIPVTGSGGYGTLTYSIAPTLPTGLTFSSATGTISGTPTAVSAATTYTVTVTDSNAATSSATFTLTVNSVVTASTVIASTALTDNRAATAFIPVTASGGTGALTFSVLPALPVGLSFSASTGVISGTPTAIAGPTTYTVTATDGSGATGSATFSLIVNATVMATTAVASATLTQNHASTVFVPATASGGTSPLTYGISPALPPGLTFSASTGAVSGTPTTVSATTTYTVTITDSHGATSSATFSLTVNSAVVASTVVPSSVLIQNGPAPPIVPVTGSGGTGVLTYSVSPYLPGGISFSSSTGSVSGTPTVVSAAATYTVTVTDSNGANASATFSLTVNGLIATAIVVTSSNPTPIFGVSIVLTATVTPAPGGVSPGSISFYSGKTLLGTSALTASGVGTLSVTLPQGADAITAIYSGNARYGASTSNALSISDVAGTATTLSASPTTQLYNNPIVLAAQVASPTAGPFAGTVSFLDETTVIATVAVAMNGQAAYSATTLAQGSHNLTAAYSGDVNFQASTSPVTGIAISVGNLNLGNAPAQSVIPGGTASFTLTLSPVVTPAFLYDVKLTATGLPPGATYTFSPTLIPAGSASVPVTLTVQTAKGIATLSMSAPGGGQNSSRGLAALAFGLILPLFGLKRVRKRLRAIPKPLAAVLFGILGLGAFISLGGCGGGGFFGKTATSGNYTITVTATSANLVRTSSVQLTIQ